MIDLIDTTLTRVAWRRRARRKSQRWLWLAGGDTVARLGSEARPRRHVGVAGSKDHMYICQLSMKRRRRPHAVGMAARVR